MTISTFINDNIALIAGAVALLVAIIVLEVRSLTLRGADLSPTELSLAANRDASIIDLRNHEDYRKSHIAGAKNIPADDIDTHVSSLGAKDDEIVLYCNLGSTSAKALKKLKKQGFSNVKHLRGGITEWNNEGLPVVAKR